MKKGVQDPSRADFLPTSQIWQVRSQTGKVAVELLYQLNWPMGGKTHQYITAFPKVSFGRKYKPNLEVVTLA